MSEVLSWLPSDALEISRTWWYEPNWLILCLMVV
jgi:hypothetical protein